jgi:hypothetical protein
MSLLKTDVRKIIKKEFGDFLKGYGYKFDAKAEGFLRYFEGGFNKVGVSIVDYRPKFEVSFFFLVRLDVVEKIVQKYVFVLDQYRDLTWTLNTTIDHFTGFKEYAVRDEGALYDLLSEVKQVYSSKIDAFLKQYSEIKNMDRALNVEHAKIGYMTNTDDYIRPIIIAKLTGNKDFDKVAEWYYKKYVEDYYLDTEEGPNKIKEVINYLQTL